MLLYNVTSQIVPGYEKQWLDWLQKSHIPAMLNTECFSEAMILKVHAESDYIAYAVQYTAISKGTLNRYHQNFASGFEQYTAEMFGENVLQIATTLELISCHK